MRFALYPLLLLLSLVAWAQSAVYATELQIFTRAAPVKADFFGTNATGVQAKALLLAGVTGIRMKVCCVSGTINSAAGAGQLHAYDYSVKFDKVGRNKGVDLLQAVTTTSCSGSTCACETHPNVPTSMIVGDYLLFASSAYSCTAGTQVNVYYTASTN